VFGPGHDGRSLVFLQLFDSNSAERTKFGWQVSEMNAIAQRKHTPKKDTVATTGEIFSDSTVLEVVCAPKASRQLKLLFWNGTKGAVSSRHIHDGCLYQPADVPPSLYYATRFPVRYESHHSARQLLNRTEQLFTRYLHFAERESRLLAVFAMSTWIADRLPIAPALVISGPDPTSGIELLKLLHCLCRRPVLLGEITPLGLRALPTQFSLTLLINQQGLRPAMLRLLSVAQHRGMHLIGNRGNLIDFYCPKAIFCGSDTIEGLSESAIQISTAQAGGRWIAIDEQLQAKIADEFQPQLLSYRLHNVCKSSALNVAVESFSAATTQLAFIIGLCLSEDAELARETVQLLQAQDDDLRAQQLLDVNCVLLEVLWGLIHKSESNAVMVSDLAKFVNALLHSRGGELHYSPVEIGWKLHAAGIPRHATAAGRQVVLDAANHGRLHTLARSYLSLAQNALECKDCGDFKQRTESK
jgi:hypothetical protein